MRPGVGDMRRFLATLFASSLPLAAAFSPHRLVSSSRTVGIPLPASPPFNEDITQQQLDFVLAPETTSIVPIPLQEAVPQTIDSPQLVTFDATGTLMQLAEPVGMYYREVLLKHTGLRLPRPSIFTIAFKDVYQARCEAMPCFGCGESVSSRDWWAPVVRDTYLKVGVPGDIIDPVFPAVFNELYEDVFTGTKGWELARDAEYVLSSIKAWRGENAGAGPKLGVISNFDERLPKLLEALGIQHYFDFIITSKECGMEKPSRQIFDIALTRLSIIDRSKAVHVGDVSCSSDFKRCSISTIPADPFFAFPFAMFLKSFNKDVCGAAAAGWNAVLLKSPPYSDAVPGSDSIDFMRVGDLARVLDLFGLSDDRRPIITTPVRGVFD